MANRNQYIPQVAFHPGETLSEKLDELGMGPKEFAIRTGKPEKTIIAIIKGKSSITAEMAVQFEHVLKIPAHFWLNIQRNYDEFIARAERKNVLTSSIGWAKLFPLAEMIKKGWLPQNKSIEARTADLLAFFSISNHAAWEDYYLNQQLKVAFRISLAHTKEPYAISAWLRKGDLQASELQAPDYSENDFKDALPEIKSVMAKHPNDFANKLQSTCLAAGVKVVYTPCLPKAPIVGSTRWLNDTPLIQLSGRYKRNDIFWFTFFHEAGHIILHGKKDIFLEKIDYSDYDRNKEEEADNFAIKWTLTEDEEQEIIDSAPLTEADIKYFAKKFNTHPAIIIGRLQHDELIPYGLGSQFFKPVIFN
ncbi:MAG: HigA family addiction module antidote protein [Candidatus Atribacteria bacterium]|jgi:addiction module HigA family antidote|nr:HigA family addiction module antidote protein [Candidatus Atribacteria bacterium]